jgi:serine/threonine protein kinase
MNSGICSPSCNIGGATVLLQSGVNLAEARNCETCGRALDASAAGLCPSCLLRTAIEHGAGQTSVSQFPKLHYFGDYELLEEIARGGMGVVYRARQVSLDRIVAVKMMRPGLLATDAEIRRFHAEAKTAAGLQHPNIVAIHEVGEIDGLHYFSMDFVDGPSLADLVRERALSPIEAAGHVKTLAETVHYAHSRGILHRDLKPSNILIDSAGRPRITDFGLARPLGSDSSVTVHGTVVGTPAYMPPEQASGDPARLCRASDVYSLGAILYELLTGLAPFRGATQLETVRMVLEQRPVSPRKLASDVPRALEDICIRCLEKESAARYASAADLAGDLDRFLRGEKPGWWAPPSRRGVVGMALVTLLIFVGYNILRTNKPKPAPGFVKADITRSPVQPLVSAEPPPAPRKIMKRVSTSGSSRTPWITSEPGPGEQLVFTFRSPTSAPAIKVAAAQIGFRDTGPVGPRDCAITVEPDSRRVFLQSDPVRGPQLRISGSIGTASSIENSVCAVDLANLTAEPNIGGKFWIRVPVTFKRGFDGSREIHFSLTGPNGRVFSQVDQHH